MDELAESLGQLSTHAKEWKPSSPKPQQTLRSPALQLSPPGRNVNSSSSQKLQHATLRSPVLQLSPPGRNVNPSGSDWQPPEWKPAASKEFIPSWQKSPSYGQPDPEAQGYTDVGDSQEEATSHEQSASTLVSGSAPPPPVRTMHSLGVSEDRWRYQRDVALESQREMDPSDPRHKAVPPPFSNAYQLDDIPRGAGSRSSFGYPTSVFKVLNREDGHLYCLRRVDNVRSVSYKIATAVTERWNNKGATVKSGLSAVEHPGVVRFYRCFVSNRAVFFLHQYVPGARTLRERFLGTGVPLPEPLIWSCITQLVAAIRVVHAENLACRVIHLNHILCSTADGLMDRVRLQLNCLGVVDALEFEARKQVGELQLEDMRDLGRLILSLASGAEITRSSDNDTMRRCDAYVGQNYSREIHSFAFSLLAPNSNAPSIHDVSRAISGRAFDEMDLSRVTADRTETALSAEYESGRALRLLLKLGFVNERPEFGMNRRWQESGDCYVLKLFRDYVFHQADGAGRPIMDLGHVVTALNKLDAADEEKIVLSSRDGKSIFVVSYADVARCLDNAFNELCGGAVLPGVLQY